MGDETTPSAARNPRATWWQSLIYYSDPAGEELHGTGASGRRLLYTYHTPQATRATRDTERRSRRGGGEEAAASAAAAKKASGGGGDGGDGNGSDGDGSEGSEGVGTER